MFDFVFRAGREAILYSRAAQNSRKTELCMINDVTSLIECEDFNPVSLVWEMAARSPTKVSHRQMASINWSFIYIHQRQPSNLPRFSHTVKYKKSPEVLTEINARGLL